MKKEEFVYSNKPIYLKDKNQIIYGYFPQAVVSDKNIINQLNKLSSPTINGYYELDNVYYEKFLSWPFDTKSCYSDGSLIKRCEYNWFKVEPVVWDIISIDDDIYFIKTNKILINHVFDNEGKLYKDSDILLYLCKELYPKMFFGNEDYLEYSILDYGETSEKLFLLSEDDVKDKTDEERKAKPTDYALAAGAMSDIERNSCYWLRNLNEYHYDVQSIYFGGEISRITEYCPNVGVVVAARMKYDFFIKNLLNK